MAVGIHRSVVAAWLAMLVALVACGGAGTDERAGGDAAAAPAAPSAGAAPASGSPSSASPSASAPPADADSGVPARAEPPPLPTYSHGTCPMLVGGPTQATSINTAFASGTQSRGFHLVVPPSYDGTKAWPVVFAWHWLNASAGSFIDQGQLESATEQMKFIAVVPEKLKNGAGNKVYQMDWPFVETWGAADELTFVDDLFACVANQYKVDPARVYGIGVSAGALWATYISTTDHVKHFAAIESLSGGLGADPVGVWKMDYVAQPNKFPALVLWGGPTDFLGVDFQKASMAYRDALRKDGHFVLQCVHTAGHAMPPVDEPTDGGTKFAMLWQFMLDHPYGLPPGTSPYKSSGLPGVFPPWCALVP